MTQEQETRSVPIEALMRAWEFIHYYGSEKDAAELRAIIDQPKEETVAWMRKQIEICGGEVVSLATDRDNLQGDQTTCDDYPLYLHPQPQVAVSVDPLTEQKLEEWRRYGKQC